MPKVNLHNQEGKVIGTVDLPKIFEGEADRELLWQAVRMYLANKRQGTAQTKTIGEVRGGGKKPWAQKHTGRARQGSIRSPLWRKGGVVFGPHPREHRYALPAQLRREALVASLRAKVGDNAVSAIDSLEGFAPKTKALAQLLGKMKVSPGVLVVIDRPNSLLARICRNIPKVSIKPAADLNCYDVLAYPQLVLTKAGLKQLEEIVTKGGAS